MLATWLYISVPSFPASAEAATIDAIMEVSRCRNADLDVTGALIFSGSHFAQYIEGPHDSVAVLRAAIESDRRHGNIASFEADMTRERRFAGWSLAYSGRSVFVDSELRRIIKDFVQDTIRASRNLKLVLSEFSQAGGFK